VDETAMALLRSYNWPGNIRELHNVLERAAILAHGCVIWPEDLPDLNVPPDAGDSPAEGHSSRVSTRTRGR
jgi:DNA-binding NtrC family response regulator